MLGYYNNPEATKEVFTDDGYFRTGDLGYVDDEGYIFITGRKKNVIILANGKNIYPEELEEYLYKLDVINECVVVAREVGGRVAADGGRLSRVYALRGRGRRADQGDDQSRDYGRQQASAGVQADPQH